LASAERTIGVVLITGKGFFIWKILKCENGNVQKIAKLARQAGYSHVLIKVANGLWKYNYDWKNKIDYCPDLVQALRDNGVEPWGWHYVFGEDPVREARAAIERVIDLELKGYVIDAEAHYKRVRNRHAAAKTFMKTLRQGVGKNVPLALSSYRYPSMHPEIPWNEFLSKCDLNMPQVYWIHSQNPGDQLEQTLREFASPRFTAKPPILPTGAAFTEHGWTATASEALEFLDAARTLNLEAANFWEWHAARDRIPEDVWETIYGYDWESGSSLPVDIVVDYIEALNSQTPESITALYSPTAIHVTSTRTISGSVGINSWYQQFLTQILPEASFTLTGYEGRGGSRHLTWTANSNRGQVLNGKDTFGLNPEGKISYHYTFFSVS
jgi:hypothetical protein